MGMNMGIKTTPKVDRPSLDSGAWRASEAPLEGSTGTPFIAEMLAGGEEI